MVGEMLCDAQQVRQDVGAGGRGGGRRGAEEVGLEGVREVVEKVDAGGDGWCEGATGWVVAGPGHVVG